MKYSAVIAVAAAAAANAKLEPITMKGSKLFYTNGTEFFMKGVAYQQDSAAGGETNDKKTKYMDPLADEKACKRDVPLLKELGTNIIRTYAINPEADHEACMKLLDDAGIYVISDLSEPSVSINRDDPKWDIELYERYIGVVDELAKYDNVVGFFAGNEVSNNVSNTQASAFVKAAVRDTKKHIKSKFDRWLGVGYASNDDVDIREDIADYFNCGEDDERIDYWGYNIYSWCGKSSMKDSGYSDQAKFFKDYSVPVFFAEYGCNEPGGAAERIFDETTALYEKEMTDVFSGGIVYMYHQEANDYGLVKINKNGDAVKQKDFNQLKKKATAAQPQGVDKDDYKPSGKAASCPSQSKTWKVNSALPPSPDKELCDCMVKSRTCVPADDLKTKDFNDMFGYICGEDQKICTAINANATAGIYGAYSMCDNEAKLAYILDAYYKAQNKAADACDFKGKATTQKAENQDSCKSKLDAASKINEEVATATAAAGGASSTGDAQNSEEDDESFGLQAASIGRLFSMGDYAVGAYMAVAGVVGAGMVLL